MIDSDRYFHLYFLNMDISLTIHSIDLNISVFTLKVLPEGTVSHFFYLGPSLYLMTTNW